MWYRIVVGLLLVVLITLQVPLWLDKGVPYWIKLSNANKAQRMENEQLRKNNELLLLRFDDLRVADSDALEELAREELGMIKREETFVRLIRDSRHLQKTDAESQ